MINEDRVPNWAGGDVLAYVSEIVLSYSGGEWWYSGAGSLGGTPYDSSGLWCRTTAASGTADLDPATYLTSTSDPELYPNAACTPSERISVVKSTPICRMGCTCANGKTVCPLPE